MTLTDKLRTLKLANAAYASGSPFMTDAEYDQLWREIRDTDPDCPDLFHTAKDPNRPNHVPHLIPLLSPLKAFEPADLKPFLARFKNQDLLIQPKFDGIAAVLYNQGSRRPKLVKSGDGVTGEDISRHLPGITLPVNWHKQQAMGVEILIPLSRWNSAWGKNPRNTAAGWINSTELPRKDVLEAVSHEHHPIWRQIKPPYTLDELQELFLSLYVKWSSHYPMDGLMVKLLDPKMRTQVGHNQNNYLWSLAWKPPIQASWTTVDAIEWNVSRSGRVIPKVRFIPLELCGTVNQFATANNAAWLEQRRIHVEAEILVGKAGEIIPKILEWRPHDGAEAQLPETCPFCDSYLSREGVDLVCNSDGCMPKLVKRIAYFYSDKGMDLKSIGEAMIEQLLTNMGCRQVLENSPWALLEPDTFDLLPLITSIWGEARTETYLDNLAEISGAKNPAHFVAGLGMKNLAYKTALACFQAFTGSGAPKKNLSNSVNSFVQAVDLFKKASGQLRYFSLLPVPKPAVKTYCITGTLSVPRTDMIDYLAKYDWQPSNQVSKYTDLLILGELNKVSTKLKKAKDLGIPIYAEHEIPKLMEDTNERKLENNHQIDN